MSQQYIIDSQALIESENDNSETQALHLHMEDSDGDDTHSAPTSPSINTGGKEPSIASKENNSGTVTPDISGMDISNAETTTSEQSDQPDQARAMMTEETEDQDNTRFAFMDPEDREFCLNLERMVDQQEGKKKRKITETREELNRLMSKRVTLTYDVDTWITGKIIKIHSKPNDSYEYVVIQPSHGYHSGQYVVIELDRIRLISHNPRSRNPSETDEADQHPPEKMSCDPSMKTETQKQPEGKSSPTNANKVIKHEDPKVQTTQPPKRGQHKRTETGWQQTDKADSYANKAKRATKDKGEMTFTWTKLEAPTTSAKETPEKKRIQQKKEKWIKALHKAVQNEISNAHSSSEWPDFNKALMESFKKMEMLEVEDVAKLYHLSSENFLTNNRLIDQIWAQAIRIHEEKIQEEINKSNQWKAEFTEQMDTERKMSSKPAYGRIQQILVKTLNNAGVRIHSPTTLQKFMSMDIYLPTNAKLTKIWQEAKQNQKEYKAEQASRRLTTRAWKKDLEHKLMECRNPDHLQRRKDVNKVFFNILQQADVYVTAKQVKDITAKYNTMYWTERKIEKLWKDAEHIVELEGPQNIEYGQAYHKWTTDLRYMIAEEDSRKTILTADDLQGIYIRSLRRQNISVPYDALFNFILTVSDQFDEQRLQAMWRKVQNLREINHDDRTRSEQLYEEWSLLLQYFFNRESRMATNRVPFQANYHKALRDSFHTFNIFITEEFASQFHLPGISSTLTEDKKKDIWTITYDHWVDECRRKYLMADFEQWRDARPSEQDYKTKSFSEWTLILEDCVDIEEKETDLDLSPSYHHAILTSLMHMGLYLHPRYLEKYVHLHEIKTDYTTQREIWSTAKAHAIRARRHVSHSTKHSPPYYILIENWKYHLRKAHEHMCTERRIQTKWYDDTSSFTTKDTTILGYSDDYDYAHEDDDSISPSEAADTIIASFIQMEWDTAFENARKCSIMSKEDYWDPYKLEDITVLCLTWDNCEYELIQPIAELGHEILRGVPRITKTQSRDNLMSPDYETMNDNVPWKYTELPMTRDGKVDSIQLNFDYQRTLEQHQLSFRDWIRVSNAAMLLNKDDRLTAEEPQVLGHITRTGHREFFLANWMLDYPVMRLNFETWYDMIGHKLKVPKQTRGKIQDGIIRENHPKRAESYADAGIPALVMHPICSDKYVMDHAIHHCNLQAPPKFERTMSPAYEPTRSPTPEPKKSPRQLSWSDQVDNDEDFKSKKPKLEVEDTCSEADSSTHRATETYIIRPDGTAMSWKERQDYYKKKETEQRDAIKDEIHRPRFVENMSLSEYNGVIKTIAVKSPPMDRTVWELEAIKGNTILDPRVEHPWVEAHHFMPGGKLAHIYIPRYVYIPHDVFDKCHLWLKKGTTSYTAFWRHLLMAQDSANKQVTTEHLKDTNKTDYRAMLTSRTPKTIITRKIDIVQHKCAHIEAERIGWKAMTRRNIYDWFIRPIERLFAVDMPQGTLLMRALLFNASAQKLHEIVTRFMGIPKNARITPIELAEEMSRIRMSFDIDFQMKLRGRDRPTFTLTKLKLTPDDEKVYFIKTSDEANTDNTLVDGDDTDSIYADEISEWDSIVKEYHKVKSESKNSGEVPKWITPWLYKTRQQLQTIVTKCQRKCYIRKPQEPLDIPRSPHIDRKHITTVSYVRPNKNSNDENKENENPSTSSDQEDDEPMDTIGQLGKDFTEKLTFPRRLASCIRDTDKLTKDQQRYYTDMKYYADKVDEIQLDIIKADSADNEFIDILTRAKDNLIKARETAAEELQRLLDQQDVQQRKKQRKLQKKQRQKAMKQQREMKRKAPTTTVTKQRPSRPTEMPTAKQINNQNPWKVNTEPKTTRTKPTGTRPKYTTPANTTAGSPSETSFTKDITVTSTPKHQSTIQVDELEDTISGIRRKRTRPLPTLIDSLHEYSETDEEMLQPPYHPSAYKQRTQKRRTGSNVRNTSSTQQPVTRRTRQGSPSPPRPLNTKFVRKKAPNGDYLYHYKLWSPHNTTYPRFTNKHLSAKDVTQYLTGTVSNDDVVTPNNTVIITAHGLSSYRKITLKPNVINHEVELTEISTEEGVEYGHMQINGFNIPMHILPQLIQLVATTHEQVTPPMNIDRTQYEKRIHRERIITPEWKFKATIKYQHTRKGPERIVLIEVNRRKASRNETDTGYIIIPWLLLTKLVNGLENIRQYLTSPNPHFY